MEFTATTATSESRSSETMAMHLVPTTVVPRLAKAPVVDGTADDVYEADDIAVGKHWEGDECEPDGKDCGTGSTATLGWYDDALYAHVTVVDDTASAAAPPDRCFGHWLVDSVEFLVDPRGTAPDTSSTFKLGMFPFSDDPTNSNGNGVNGPCWSRDADNHQGFSTGPLAQRVKDAPNAPGVEVAVDVERARDGSYVGGSYEVEVKVPLAALPAAVGPTSTPPTGHRATNDVDPDHMGLNLTPYDSDRTDFIGETRTGWSAFDSQQSEPGRWGHAYLEGYEPPAGRALEASPAIIPDTALTGVESPQTIHQSAARGITMSGVQPSEALTVTDAVADGDGIAVHYVAKRAGTLRGFVWKGDTRFVPVWTSSCKGDVDGFDACSDKAGAAPPWAPDMGGRLRASAETDVQQGAGTMRIPVAADALERLAPDGRLLLSWAEAGHNNGDGVTAWSYPIVAGDGPEPSPSPTAAPGDDVTPGLPRTGAALGRSGTGTTCAR